MPGPFFTTGSSRMDPSPTIFPPCTAGGYTLIRRRLSALALLLFLLLSVPAGAAVLDDIKKDFKPISGYVIMPIGDEFLIDLDASKGVGTGDLFSVVKPGERIIHPVTKEVLGTLDQVKGILEVTRVKSGYSYARPLPGASGIQRADVTRRYENIPTVFWDYTGQGEPFFNELKSALPSLEWQDYAAAQASRPAAPTPPPSGGAILVFVLRYDGLEVRDADFQVIHAYPPPPGIAAAAAPAQAAAPNPVPVPAIPSVPSPSAPPIVAGGGPVQWESAPAGRSKGGYEIVFPGFETIAPLPKATVMADFLRDGDRFLLATTDGHSLEIFSVDGTLNSVAKGQPSLPGQILAVHWWRPDLHGPPYLAVTSSVEVNQATTPEMSHTISGSIFVLQDGQLIPVRESLQFILGTFDRDGDGVPETLLGQNFDRDIFFGRDIRELRLVGGKIETTRSSLDLPPPFPVQGSLLADLTGDGRSEAIFVRRRVLYIYDGDKLLYESPRQMGGSLSAMTYARNPGAQDRLNFTEGFEVAPVAADLDGDGRRELLAISGEGFFVRAPGIGPGVNKSWLSVLKFRDGVFVRGKLGDDLDSPIQGLTVDSQRALLVLTQSGSLLSKAGKSFLLSFPLNH
jgi:hypothetical protein